jgi:uncharacterized protein (DUF433 family)
MSWLLQRITRRADVRGGKSGIRAMRFTVGMSRAAWLAEQREVEIAGIR